MNLRTQNKIKESMKIYKVRGCESLDKEFDLPEVKALKADYFVYYYESGSYEGSGFAVWKKDGKYFYSDLGHCSCYGPTERLDSIPYDSLEEIEKFADNYNCGFKVIERARSLV